MTSPPAVDPAAVLSPTAEFRVPRQTSKWTPRKPSDEAHRPAYAPVPLPPTDAELFSYRKRRLAALMVPSLVSFGCLITSQLLFVRLTPWLWLLAPLLFFTVVYYLISLAVNLFTPGFDLARHQELVRTWRPARYPSVDVFLPVCGEPAHVLRNTWEHVRAMGRHYRGEVTVYVLDDSPNEAMERMALAFGFVYQRRPNRGWFKKAGNMRYAFERTMSDFILVLDADFVPRKDMLDQMLPWFDAEPNAGIVQSPQFFRVHLGQTWVERGAGAVQELFYRSVQVSRQAHDSAICVGSCAVYRRDALFSIGGSTLIEHSEDVHTGFDLRMKGWNLRYIPVVLAAGLCPSDVDSFFTQQYRWCAGSMSLLGSRKFWSTKLRLRARLSYISGFCYYLHTGLFTFVAPVIPVLMLTAFAHQIALANYLLILPSVVYNMIIFPFWHRSRYGLESWTVKMLYGWAHAFAIIDIVRGRRMGWQPTGGTAKKSKTRRLWTAMKVWTAGTGLVWAGVAGWRMLVEPEPWIFVPALLSAVFYLAVVGQALLVDPERDVEVVR
ncbi:MULTISPECIES: glycosyltransferase family 2 protein [unclassified Micromonospora]|uniref:glycosyltransferase family 2 protein n=1 Tax=unclassified Micromonospora TaxID=2617518 RepID=UPI001C5FC70D|nr:cellulose synthase catalytic subunit [Micromonospora sp. RL09-050-HVF-A]MBW4703001.1 glycosyltransferase [Micromonospora sp. RL09-050-HVF-A]